MHTHAHTHTRTHTRAHIAAAALYEEDLRMLQDEAPPPTSSHFGVAGAEPSYTGNHEHTLIPRSCAVAFVRPTRSIIFLDGTSTF